MGNCSRSVSAIWNHCAGITPRDVRERCQESNEKVLLDNIRKRQLLSCRKSASDERLGSRNTVASGIARLTILNACSGESEKILTGADSFIPKRNK